MDVQPVRHLVRRKRPLRSLRALGHIWRNQANVRDALLWHNRRRRYCPPDDLPANTVYVQLCLESAQYGRMCNVFPLPYSDEDMYYVMYDHMPEGEYTLYVRY